MFNTPMWCHTCGKEIPELARFSMSSDTNGMIYAEHYECKVLNKPKVLELSDEVKSIAKKSKWKAFNLIMRRNK